MINALCFGYDPLNRKRFAGQLLDEIYQLNSLIEELKTAIITLIRF